MPTRNYNPVTPSGDPTNVLSLLTPSISVPQVNFTAQTAVAQPENQYETLQRILVSGTQAVTGAMKFQENKIRNELAVNAAIERAQAKQEEEIAKEERKEAKKKVLEREAQNDVLNTYDARITSALLQENFDEANTLADEFSGLYPIEDNPYMANKAADQRVRINTAQAAWEANKDREERTISAAARGFVISDILRKIEAMEANFANPETREEVMALFRGEYTVQTERGEEVRYGDIPEDQLHIRTVDYLLQTANPAKLELLTDEDRIELSTAILGRTSTFRTGIISERNNRRRYARIEQRGMAAAEISLTLMDNPADTMPKLDALFSFFDQLEDDKQAGFITSSQQRNLEGNLVASIATNAGIKNPVVGALTVMKLIEQGMATGDIPEGRGRQVMNALKSRAEREMDGVMRKMIMEAQSNDAYNDQTALYESSPNVNPALDLAQRYGIYETMPDGTTRITAGMEGIAKKLESLSDEWIRQQKSYEKTGGVAGNVLTIDNTYFIDQQVQEVEEAMSTNTDLNVFDRNLAMTNLAIQEWNGVLANASDLAGREQHLVPLKRIIDKELAAVETDQGEENMFTLTVAGGRKFRIPREVAESPDFRNMVGEVDNPDEMARILMKYYNDQVADMDASSVGYGNRMVFLYGQRILLDRIMTESQKKIAENPTLASTYTQQELADVAQTNSSQFYKRYKKMDRYQRSSEENRIARIVAASNSVPTDWIKYLGESYFEEGASDAQLQEGFGLLVRSRGTVIDNNGNPVNFASIGTIASEIAMAQENPVMYDTIVIAEGLSIGTNRPPEDYLKEAHVLAVRRHAELKAATGNRAKTALDLVPQPEINYQTGLPMRSTGTRTGQQLESLRSAFQEVFNKDIPRVGFDYAGISNDPYFSMDTEDYNRMNAVFQGFRQKGYSDNEAVRASVATMKKMGYSVVVNEESGGPRVGLIFDPYAVNPPEDIKKTADYKEWLGNKISDSVGYKVNLSDGKTRVAYLMTGDLMTPDSTVPFVVILPDLTRIEFTRNGNGVNYREYQKYLNAKRNKEEAERINPAF